MNFKEWLIQLEALDANTKELLLKAKAPKQELDAFIKELEDEPTLIDKKTAFQRFQSKFNIQNKEKPKDEDAQRKHFATIPNTTEEELKTYDYYKSESPQSLKEMMELLRKFIDKKLITLEIKDNKPVIIRNTTEGKQKFDTPDFTRFMSALHGIQASLQKYKGKGKYFNPIEEELNHQNNLVAKANNIWVFKGHAPDVCRIYGKGHPWCISSSTSATHWFSYRMDHHQTQYFVFDYNKDEDDPARYVNPGVAPEGMYSEWVDARNQHSEDPEDPNSAVGINGYRSINEYKKYLASKGIPESIWVTTAPEEWEERLSNYDEDEDLQGAKNDPDPRVFPMYLKIVNRIEDSDFDTLDADQKKEFLLGKIDNLTDKQFDYALKNIKSEYYNSLSLDRKIKFAGKTNNQDLLLKLAENPNLNDVYYGDLLKYALDKDNMAELIINKNPELFDDDVYLLLHYATNKDKIAKLLQKEKDNISELSDNSVQQLLFHAADKDEMATDKDEMAKLIIKYKKELSGDNVENLLMYATDKDKIAELLQRETDNISKLNVYNFDNLLGRLKYRGADKIAEIIINKKPKLSDEDINSLIKNVNNKEKIAEIIINKQPELSDWVVGNLLRDATDKDKMAKLIIEKKPQLSDSNVENLLNRATDQATDKIAELIIEKKPELSDKNVKDLLDYTKDKNEIAKLLQKETDNISKLSDIYVSKMLKYGEIAKKAQILNQYHTKKTPEIQKLLDKYL